VGASDEEYLDSLLNSALGKTEPTEEPEFFPNQDIVEELNRDAEREEDGGNVNKVEQMETKDVVDTSLENLLASGNLPIPEVDEDEEEEKTDLEDDYDIDALFSKLAEITDAHAAQEALEQPEDIGNNLEDNIGNIEVQAAAEEPAQEAAETILPDMPEDITVDVSADGMPDIPEDIAEDVDSMSADVAEEESVIPEAILEDVPGDDMLDDIKLEVNQEPFADSGEMNEEPLPDLNEPDDSSKELTSEDIAALLREADANADGAEPLSDELAEEAVTLAVQEDAGEEGDEASDNGKKKKKGKKEKKEKKEKPKKEKVKKEKAPKEDDSGKPKKKGFFQMLLDFVTEEEVDESVENVGSVEVDLNSGDTSILESLPEKGDTRGESGENAKSKKKNKKEKASKPKKEKKPKKQKSNKKKKPAKPAKPKEEKPRRPQRPFPKKLVVSMVILALTIFAGIYLIASQLPKVKELSDARKAFYNRDYKAAFEGFYGKKLHESDQALYNQAYAILKMQRRVEAYQNYKSLGLEVEALDALMQGVEQFDELYAYAQMNNAATEVMSVYQELLNILQSSYGLTEEQARDIVAEEDDLIYTLRLEALVGGYDYVNPYEDLDFYLNRLGIDAGSDASQLPAKSRQTSGDTDSADTDVDEEVLPEENLLEQESVPESPELSEESASDLEEEQYITE